MARRLEPARSALGEKLDDIHMSASVHSSNPCTDNSFRLQIIHHVCMRTLECFVLTWTWKIWPGAELGVLRLKLLRQLCNAGFIYLTGCKCSFNGKALLTLSTDFGFIGVHFTFFDV